MMWRTPKTTPAAIALRAQLLALPAYQIAGSSQLAAWCPCCERVHSHGDTGATVEERVADHVTDDCKNSPHGYRLVRIGTVRSIAAVPRLTADETLRVSKLLDRGIVSLL